MRVQLYLSLFCLVLLCYVSFFKCFLWKNYNLTSKKVAFAKFWTFHKSYADSDGITCVNSGSVTCSGPKWWQVSLDMCSCTQKLGTPFPLLRISYSGLGRVAEKVKLSIPYFHHELKRTINSDLISNFIFQLCLCGLTKIW